MFLMSEVPLCEQVVKAFTQPPPTIQFSLFLLRTRTFWGYEYQERFFLKTSFWGRKNIFLSHQIRGGVCSQEDTLQRYLAHKKQPPPRTLQ